MHRTFEDRIGLPQLLKWVGNPALAGFTAPKLLWVRENEPEVYGRIATVLLPKDYINFRLHRQADHRILRCFRNTAVRCGEPPLVR